MDYAACHVIYLDNRVSKDRCEQRDSTQQQSLNEPDDLQGNLRILMSTFNTGMKSPVKVGSILQARLMLWSERTC